MGKAQAYWERGLEEEREWGNRELNEKGIWRGAVLYVERRKSYFTLLCVRKERQGERVARWIIVHLPLVER